MKENSDLSNLFTQKAITNDLHEIWEQLWKGMYIIGDGSGITHSLSHASASGVHVARNIVE